MLALKLVAPLYPHDCNACRFLGRFKGLTGGDVDLYLCPQDACLVVRYGEHDHQNCALGLDLGEKLINRSEAHAETLRRAKAAGLLT